jgi:formate hydrogenlyase subunit 3/multisubunit Na+/H+ antiporter MnhD subunit
MAILKEYKADLFTIIAIISFFILLIYIGFCAFFFYDFAKSPPSPPTQDESWIMTIVSVILFVIIFIMFIYGGITLAYRYVPYFKADPTNVGITANKPGNITLVNSNIATTITSQQGGKLELVNV